MPRIHLSIHRHGTRAFAAAVRWKPSDLPPKHDAETWLQQGSVEISAGHNQFLDLLNTPGKNKESSQNHGLYIYIVGNTITLNKSGNSQLINVPATQDKRAFVPAPLRGKHHWLVLWRENSQHNFPDHLTAIRNFKLS